MFVDTRLQFDTLLLSEAVDVIAVNQGGIRTIEDSTKNWLSQSVANFATAVSDIRIDHVTSQMIYDFHQQVDERATAVTANNYLRALNIVFKRLTERGYLAQNPAKHVPYLHEPQAIPRAIHEITYHQLREVADTRRLAIIDLLWESGCRISGLTSIKRSSVEMWQVGEEWRFKAKVKEKGKAGKKRGSRTRTIYAAGTAVISIKEWLAIAPESDYLFCVTKRSPGKPINKNTIQSILRLLKKKANITSTAVCNYHAFRHAFALRKLDEGYDIAVVSQWLGHSDPAFTAKIYCIRTEQQLQEKFFSPP